MNIPTNHRNVFKRVQWNAAPVRRRVLWKRRGTATRTAELVEKALFLASFGSERVRRHLSDVILIFRADILLGEDSLADRGVCSAGHSAGYGAGLRCSAGY